ncbi:colicin transporter [Escherichia coli]|uniref:colicin E1 family microcin immunity protein n=1 Tax=Escherichia coli TaxID=562 RepID=UPI000B429DAD|nr:colicin E1 family microcin immunity protein [Escherichia coli]EER9292452.1 colicin transporter [Escherichia coli]OWF09968.1 colicin transporter [Escherichia coli]OWF19881.1 colicin transporter [Escherichia coli]OWF25623.1 colicin transporter [Escherichia coli]HAM4347475.1 colicin transporter [Escherichia coli]
MSLRYYIKNILFGLYCALIYIYLITKNNEGYYFLASDKMLYAIVISTILCPYSKYAIEHIFFKFIKKDFFRKRKNLNNAPVAKSNLFMLYNLLCLVLAIPFGLLGLFISIKNN